MTNSKLNRLISRVAALHLRAVWRPKQRESPTSPTSPREMDLDTSIADEFRRYEVMHPKTYMEEEDIRDWRREKNRLRRDGDPREKKKKKEETRAKKSTFKGRKVSFSN